MGIQQIQEHVHFTFKKETIDKLIKLGQSNNRIYVDLASKERKLLSEIVRDPNIISNRKYASKENNWAYVNKDTDAECIVRYIKRNDSYINLSTLIASSIAQ